MVLTRFWRELVVWPISWNYLRVHDYMMFFKLVDYANILVHYQRFQHFCHHSIMMLSVNLNQQQSWIAGSFTKDVTSRELKSWCSGMAQLWRMPRGRMPVGLIVPSLILSLRKRILKGGRNLIRASYVYAWGMHRSSYVMAVADWIS